MKELQSLTKLSLNGITNMANAHANYKKARAMQDDLLLYAAKKFQRREMEGAGWFKRWMYNGLSPLEFLKKHTPAFYSYDEILGDIWTETQYKTYNARYYWYNEACAIKALLDSNEQEVYIGNDLQRFINYWASWSETEAREGIDD